MTTDQIKQGVDAGHSVYWKNPGYPVVNDASGQYLIKCAHTGSCIGLTWDDGQTLNGKPEDFHTSATKGGD